jgi:phosphohistidine phosphatase
VRVLLIRHAIAADRVEFARSGRRDAERPLTEEGRRRMTLGSLGIHEVAPTVDVVASSPYVRAMETAAIVAAAYDEELKVQRLSALEPGGDPEALVQWLRRRNATETVALVGHEPDMSALISFLLTGSPASAVTMKKGAACLLEFDGDVAPGEARLVWLLRPKHLRALGRDDA